MSCDTIHPSRKLISRIPRQISGTRVPSGGDVADGPGAEPSSHTQTGHFRELRTMGRDPNREPTQPSSHRDADSRRNPVAQRACPRRATHAKVGGRAGREERPSFCRPMSTAGFNPEGDGLVPLQGTCRGPEPINGGRNWTPDTGTGRAGPPRPRCDALVTTFKSGVVGC